MIVRVELNSDEVRKVFIEWLDQVEKFYLPDEREDIKVELTPQGTIMISFEDESL